MNPEEKQAEILKELRAVLVAQKAELEALVQEAAAQGLPIPALPTLEEIEATAPPEIAAEVRRAVAEVHEVLAELMAPPESRTKLSRKMRNTV